MDRRARHRKHRTSGGVGVSAASLLAEALVHLKDTGITTSGGQVTGWTNSGTGGSGYDLDTVEGTAAGLTKRQYNDIDVVDFAGNANLVAGDDQSIGQPYTVMVVWICRADLIGQRGFASDGVL